MHNPHNQGDFVAGKKCGQGVFRYASGNVYSGDYKDGKQNGKVRVVMSCAVIVCV